jgi:hypothetical protein
MEAYFRSPKITLLKIIFIKNSIMLCMAILVFAGLISCKKDEPAPTTIPAPSLVSFTPTTAAQGATVTIAGTNFTGATAVSFGGTAAASFTVVSATSITAVVGAGASGNVSVTTAGGITSLAGFVFSNPPAPQGIAFSIGGSAGNDYGKHAVVDASGNIILASYFYGTVDFDPSASVSNNTAVGAADVGISKYNNAGEFQWTVSFGSSGVDIPHSVATDAAGNIYAVGYFSGNCDFDPGAGVTIVNASGGNPADQQTNRDGFIVKFNSAGVFQWVKTYANANTEENCFGVKPDNVGNVFVTGVFQGNVNVAGISLASNGVQDVMIAKLDASTGNALWAYGMGGAGQDEGSAVDIDNSGNIIFTGYFSQSFDADPSANTNTLTSAGGFDTYFLKFNTSGSLIAANKFGRGGADIVAPGGIAIDNTNNIYLCGNFTGTCNFGGTTKTSNGAQDFFVAKFNNSGAFQSVVTAGGSEGDQCHRLAIDASGNIFITGWFRTTTDFGKGISLTARAAGGGHDIYFAKYNSGGTCQWSHRAGGTVSGVDELSLGTSVALIGSDKALFAGRFQGTDDFDPNPTSVKTLTSNGAGDIWVAIYNASTGYLFK